GDVVFEVGITGERWKIGERGAAEIGMQDDARGVDYAPQRGSFEASETLLDALLDGQAGKGGAHPNLFTDLPKDAADLIHDQATRILAGEMREPIQNLVHRGKVAKLLFFHQVTMVSQIQLQFTC